MIPSKRPHRGSLVECPASPCTTGRRYDRMKRLTVSLKRGEALSATRLAISANRLVYVPVADKPLRYGQQKSPIVYIGTTRHGVGRIAVSVAFRARQIFKRLRGVHKFHARIITCRRRQKIQSWRILESALLLRFRARFGELPKCNSMGKSMKEGNELKYFSKTRLNNLIDELSHSDCDASCRQSRVTECRGQKRTKPSA